MNKIAVIIKREYMTRVRTKGFVIGTILTPLLMIGLILLPAFLATRSGGERHITILDQSGDPLLYSYIEKKAKAVAGTVEQVGDGWIVLRSSDTTYWVPVASVLLIEIQDAAEGR